MARSISAPALAALAAGTCTLTGALRIMTPTPTCLWGGPWDLTIDGYVYKPLNDNSMTAGPKFAIGSTEIGLEIELSGLNPLLMPVVTEKDWRGMAAVQHRLFFDQHGTTLLDAVSWFRGKVDSVRLEDVIGGTSTIYLGLEGVARGLGQSRGRKTADQDQRLISATDGSHRYVSSAGEIVLYTGGEAPSRAAGALNGGRTGSGGTNPGDIFARALAARR